MTELIGIIAVIGLVISNIYLTYSIVKTKILEKSKDLFEFKQAIEPKKEKPQETPSDFIPLYNDN